MDQFEKALACKTLAPLRHELFEKGKKAEIGEVREWKGQKVRKTANGWVPVTDGKQKSNQEESSTETKEQPQDLATLARAASDSALKVAAQGPNEEVRIAAKRELERRKTEGSDVFEAPKGEGISETETPKKKVSKTRQTSKVKNNKDSIPPEYDEDAEGLAGWIDDKYDVDEWDPIFLELRDSGAIFEGALDVSSYKNSSETQVVNSIFENYFESYTDLGEQDIKNILHGMVQYYSSEPGGKKTFEEEEKPSKSKKSKLDPTSKKGVEEFLKANFYTKDTDQKYKHTIKEDPKTGRIVVSGIFRCKEDIKSLNNNGAFDWGEVSHFNCNGCTSLTSLEGAPKKVGGIFNCNGCTSLTSLEGAPKKVGHTFNCGGCTSLTSLEGAPEEIGWGFDCRDCTSLTSLKGAPKKVEGDFKCFNCTSLTSLEGAPEETGWGFDCRECTSLTSLEGAPKKVGGDFNCRDCTSLTSLEGAPEEIGWDFTCNNCTSLTSLESATKKVGYSFVCNNCTSLTSLEGAPEEVGSSFYCRNAGKTFKPSEIEKICNVGKSIYL